MATKRFKRHFIQIRVFSYVSPAFPIRDLQHNKNDERVTAILVLFREQCYCYVGFCVLFMCVCDKYNPNLALLLYEIDFDLCFGVNY